MRRSNDSCQISGDPMRIGDLFNQWCISLFTAKKIQVFKSTPLFPRSPADGDDMVQSFRRKDAGEERVCRDLLYAADQMRSAPFAWYPGPVLSTCSPWPA